MNSVFRLIWHRTLSRMVVASEAARSQHKAGRLSQQVGQLPEASEPVFLNALFRPVTLSVALACPTMLVPLSISDAEARAFASPANNTNDCTSGVTTTGATVGNLATPETDALPIDGSGTYSTVAGCNANGNNQLAMSVYGAFGEGTGRGASAFGFNSHAAQWATAIGLETRATGQASIALGFGSQASGVASIAMGHGAQSEANNAIAIGYNAQAVAKNTISIGTGNEVKGEGSGAIGDPNFVSGSETYVYGNNNGTNMVPIAADNAGIFGSNNAMSDTADGSVIMGSNNDLDVANAMVFGNNADVTKEGGVALGSGSFADTEAGIVGYAPVNATPADVTNTGTTVATNAAVDVGSRQITSVAAGTALDDAVNVSQLIAVENIPLTFSGDDGTDMKRKLGERLGVEGNPASALTIGNIGVESNGTDTLTIKLAKDVNLGPEGSLMIAGGPSLSSTGIDAGNSPISNVDDAVTDDQAVNFGQLKNFDFGDAMEYYSVNSTDTDVGSNVNSDNATGINAMAAGPNASATGDNATAIGNLSSASNAGATAIGFKASAQGAKSFALGEASNAIGESSLALGANSITNARYATVLGSGTVATGQGAIALGGGAATDAASATGTGAIAIGGYGAAGRGGATANVNYSVALGSGAQAGASEGDVALGSGAETATANPVTRAAVGNTIYGGFAGNAPTSVVSVGSAGEERQITNVAAGRITAASTDAINGSQLFSVVDTGFNLSDENGANDTVKLGDTLNYTNDDGNMVATVRDNEIVYDLAERIDVTKVIAGNSTLDANGMSIGDSTGNLTRITNDGLTVAGGPSMTASGGVDAGGQPITRVAAGIAGTDAVNVAQLGQVETDLVRLGMSFSDGHGNTLQRSLGETLTIEDIADTSGNSNLSVDTFGSDTLQIVMTDQPVFGDVLLNSGGSGTITGLTNTTYDPQHIVADRAATEGQVDQVAAALTDTGFNITADNHNLGGATDDTVKLGDTLNYTNDDGNMVATVRDNEIVYDLASRLSGLQEVAIIDGPTINNTGIDMGDTSITNLRSGLNGTPIAEVEGGALSNAINAGDLQEVTHTINQSVAAAKTEVEAGLSDNIMVTDRLGADGQTIYAVDMADQVSFTKLEVGSVSIDAGNVDESGGARISGVGTGDVSAGSKDAINGGQLYNVINSGGFSTRYVNTNDTDLTPSDSFAEGQGATAVGYDARSEGKQSLALGYQAMAAHQGSVALGANASTLAADDVVERTTSITIGAEIYQFAGAGKKVVSTVSVGAAGAERTISNVAAGRISETSTDAINGSQLYAATEYVEALDSRLTKVEGDLGDISVTMPGEVTPESPGVNSGQLHDMNQDVADNTSSIAGNTTNIAGNTQDIRTNSDNITDIGNVVDQGVSFGADQGEPVNRKLGDTMVIAGDDNITMRTTGDGLQVMLNRELDVDRVIAGNTTINNEGVHIQDGPSMTLDGFDANGTVITNVAPGVSAGDAVNVGQMNVLAQRFAQKIGDVHNRIDDVARDASAGIASVAAMGNAPYVPGKLTYHVGGGHHNGESAVGVNFRRTADNGRWSLSAGFAGSRAGATIGVGIAGVMD